jgi:hypothetical protein
MPFSKRKPAADEADRLPKWFCLAAETTRDDSRTLLNFQAETIARRFGVSPMIALALAPLAFGEARE